MRFWAGQPVIQAVLLAAKHGIYYFRSLFGSNTHDRKVAE